MSKKAEQIIKRKKNITKRQTTEKKAQDNDFERQSIAEKKSLNLVSYSNFCEIVIFTLKTRGYLNVCIEQARDLEFHLNFSWHRWTI